MTQPQMKRTRHIIPILSGGFLFLLRNQHPPLELDCGEHLLQLI